jgi:hypothetical protein
MSDLTSHTRQAHSTQIRMDRTVQNLVHNKDRSKMLKCNSYLVVICKLTLKLEKLLKTLEPQGISTGPFDHHLNIEVSLS